MSDFHNLVNAIFKTQNTNGCWKMLPGNHKYFPTYLHYSPNFRSTLWVLIYLADLQLERSDPRIQKPLKTIRNHFFDSEQGVYSLKEDHFPIPCLNGNMIYLDLYFNGSISPESQSAIDFFCQVQRFDDGEYSQNHPANQYCTNSHCYGKHSCYWGILKLFKGLSFIPTQARTLKMKDLLQKCIDFILLHYVCYSSHQPDKMMIKGIDQLTFPNMYKSDFLEILWLLKREKIRSPRLNAALELLVSKQRSDGSWNLEKRISNLIVSAGERHQPNSFITQRALEVLEYYSPESYNQRHPNARS